MTGIERGHFEECRRLQVDPLRFVEIQDAEQMLVQSKLVDQEVLRRLRAVDRPSSPVRTQPMHMICMAVRDEVVAGVPVLGIFTASVHEDIERFKLAHNRGKASVCNSHVECLTFTEMLAPVTIFSRTLCTNGDDDELLARPGRLPVSASLDETSATMSAEHALVLDEC